MKRSWTDERAPGADAFFVHARPTDSSANHFALQARGTASRGSHHSAPRKSSPLSVATTPPLAASMRVGPFVRDEEIFANDRFPCKMSPLAPADSLTNGGWEPNAGTGSERWIEFDFALPVLLSEVGIIQTSVTSSTRKPIKTMRVQSITSQGEGWETIHEAVLPRKPEIFIHSAAESPRVGDREKKCHMANVQIPSASRKPMQVVRLVFVDSWEDEQEGPGAEAVSPAPWLSIAKVCFKGFEADV